MHKTFGNFIELTEKQEHLLIRFPFTTLPIPERWRNNGLTADFLAEYWETLFPMYKCPSQHLYNEIKDVIRFVANELLENAMKFNYEPAKTPIQLTLYLSDQEVRFHVTNSINPQTVEPFQHYIAQLLTEDPGELYIRQLERNSETENANESRLGLLTILQDYQAQIAWKFKHIQEEPEMIMVITMVQIDFQGR